MKQVNIHFFPFKTITKKPIESFDNIQGLYVESYPEFLAQVFSSIPNVQVYPYVNNISEDEETKEKGFSNWGLDTVDYMVKTRSNPLEGYGVTGDLFFDDKKPCFMKISVFDISNKSIIKAAKAEFKLENIFSIVINSSIKFIIQTCHLEKYMKESLVIHESTLQNPMAFLLFLQIRDMLRKRAFLPSVFTFERILDTFLAAFREQPDFLVLQIIFQDFVKGLDESVRDRLEKRIQEISSLISHQLEAREREVEDANACLQRGIAYSDKGQFDEAIKEYTRAIQLHPGYLDAYYNRAFAYSKGKRQPGKAIADFSKVIEMNSKDVDAYYNRAVSYYLIREYAKAWDDVEQVQALGSEIDPRFMESLRQALGK